MRNEPSGFAAVRYLVLDEVDRLVSSGHLNGMAPDVLDLWKMVRVGRRCRLMAFSATGSADVKGLLEGMVGGERLVEIKEGEDTNPGTTGLNEGVGSDEHKKKKKKKVQAARLPAGLRQTYVFMPHALRTSYLLASLRHLLADGGVSTGRNGATRTAEQAGEPGAPGFARSCVIFTDTCLRCAEIHLILREVRRAKYGANGATP